MERGGLPICRASGFEAIEFIPKAELVDLSASRAAILFHGRLIDHR